MNDALVQAQLVRGFAVELSATCTENPPSVRLSWRPDERAVAYEVSSRGPRKASWGSATPVPVAQNYFQDTSIDIGVTYEYMVVRLLQEGSAPNKPVGVGYILAGMALPAIDSRGTVELIVEQSIATALAPEVSRFERDLIGDGWTVIRHEVAANLTPPTVKALISADDRRLGASVIQSVFLLGHVAVPYSGNRTTDGHQEHKGAQPADVFYGDTDSSWTDTTADTRTNETPTEYPANANIPGDGKYDQDRPPGQVRFGVGRVDLSHMNAFAPKSEIELTRQYLDRDHLYRNGGLSSIRRGLVDDHFGPLDDLAFAASGYRSFPTFFGPDAIDIGPWFPSAGPTLPTYMWAYGCGPGSPTSCGGVGTTTDFAKNGCPAVFTMMFGSWFGDWNMDDCLLRAPLAAPANGLACIWAGFPHWILHPMAFGATIGACTRLNDTLQEDGAYAMLNQPLGGVHLALMGDPTLRLFPIHPPSGVSVARSNGGVELNWTGSRGEVKGYVVYRSQSLNGPFERISQEPVIRPHFIDAQPLAGEATYMVRATDRIVSGSGSYWDLSKGAVAEIMHGGPLAAQ